VTARYVAVIFVQPAPGLLKIFNQLLLGVIGHNWTSRHAMRLNSRTGTDVLPVSSKK